MQVRLRAQDRPLRRQVLRDKDGAGVHLMKHGIVIEGPLKVRRLVLYEQSGDDGRGVAGHCEERDSAEVDGAVEYIAFIGNQCTAKRGIEEVLLSDGPGDDFFGAAVLIITDGWIALPFLLGFGGWRVRGQ